MEGLAKVKVRIEGVAPLLLHSSQLADPLNPYVREMKNIHRKMAKQKTDDDHARLRRLEWEGGLYLDEKQRIVIPADNVLGMLARTGKRQRSKRDVQAGMFCEAANFALEHDGPKTIDALYEKPEFSLRVPAKNGAATVMRTRPRFPRWAVVFELCVMPDVIDVGAVKELLNIAGRLVGLGDWLPRYGRFKVTEFKEAA